MKDILNKKEEVKSYKIEFETDINEDLSFFNSFVKFVSLKNDTKYEKVERKDTNSIKMARNKDKILNEFIELFTSTKEGKEIIKKIDLLYKDVFEIEPIKNDVVELLKNGKQQEMKLEDKPAQSEQAKLVRKKVKKVIEEVETSKIVEEPKASFLLKKVKGK